MKGRRIKVYQVETWDKDGWSLPPFCFATESEARKFHDELPTESKYFEPKPQTLIQYEDGTLWKVGPGKFAGTEERALLLDGRNIEAERKAFAVAASLPDRLDEIERVVMEALKRAKLPTNTAELSALPLTGAHSDYRAILVQVHHLKTKRSAGDSDGAALVAISLGALLQRSELRALESHIIKGRKRIKDGREAHQAVHGTREERNERYARWQRWADQFRKQHPDWSKEDVFRAIQKKEGAPARANRNSRYAGRRWRIETIKRHVRVSARRGVIPKV